MLFGIILISHYISHRLCASVVYPPYQCNPTAFAPTASFGLCRTCTPSKSVISKPSGHGAGCVCPSCTTTAHPGSCGCPSCATARHGATCSCSACTGTSLRMSSHSADCGCAACGSAASHPAACGCSACVASKHPVNCACVGCAPSAHGRGCSCATCMGVSQ